VGCTWGKVTQPSLVTGTWETQLVGCGRWGMGTPPPQVGCRLGRGRQQEMGWTPGQVVEGWTLVKEMGMAPVLGMGWGCCR
jgi:hypothetical protein